MAIDFPNSPTLNDIYTVGDSSWEYDGEKWLSLGVTAPTVTAGTTTTGNAGTSASVINSGTTSAVVLDFTIPRGNTGAAGADGSWATVQSIRSVTGATDTPTLSDNGKLVTIDTTSGAVSITINNSLDLPVGCRIDFAWIGAASSVTFINTATVNATPGLKLRARYSSATLVCTATDTYLLVGDLSAQF